MTRGRTSLDRVERIDMRHWVSCRTIPALLLVWTIWSGTAWAQNSRTIPPALAEDRFKSGVIVRLSFASATEGARDSVVRLNLDDDAVALGTIIDGKGLALTKSSEIKDGKLTATLANGKQVNAEVTARDEDNDVALVKIEARGLKPIQWAAEEAGVGQWVATLGVDKTPEAVGIVSTPPRKIFPKRAYLGVVLENSATAEISQISPGMGAEKAGLRPGDIILSVDDATVKTREQLTNRLRNYRQGQTVKLRVKRGEEELDADIRLMPPSRRMFGGGALPTRQDRMNRMGGDLSRRAEDFALAIQHDTVLQPWQCGGPLLNLDGKAVGLNIARAGRVASYALPAALVIQIIENFNSRVEPTGKQSQD